MFIVHVVRQFHPGVGGLETVVLELASAQVKRRTPRSRRDPGPAVRRNQAGKNCPPPRPSTASRSFAFLISARSRYPIAPSVLRHIKDADLVHVHAIDFFFDYLAWTKPLHGRTLVVSTHGGFFHTPYAARLKRVWFADGHAALAEVLCRRRRRQHVGFRAVQLDTSEGDGLHRERRKRLQVLRDASADHFRKSITFARTLCQEQAHRPADRIHASAAAATIPNGSSPLPAGRAI